MGQRAAVAVNVPNNSTDALFLNFRTAASGVGWGAIGFGASMSNSLMFIVYPNAAGTGLTVSPRISTGHVQPQHTNDIKFTLFPDSGIINGSYVVRGMCENCRSWSGGRIDTSTSEQPLLFALGPATKINSDDLDESISIHQAKGTFQINMKTATGTPGIPSFQLEDTTSSGSDSNDDNDDDDSYPFTPRGPFYGKSTAIKAHAIIALVTFVFIFPAGYAILRLFDRVLLHAGTQSLATLLAIISIAIGISASKSQQLSPSLNAPHQIIGLIVLALMLLALALGAVGHAIYRRTKQPWKFMLAHRILGPASMGLGIGNCITGFRFAGFGGPPMVGFIVVVVIVWVGICVLVLLKRRRSMRKMGPQNSFAAMNFREGQQQQQQQGGGGGWYGQGGVSHGPAVQLQNYPPPQQMPPVYK